MIVRDNAAVIAKRRRGVFATAVSSRVKCRLFVWLFFLLSGSFNFTSVDVLHHTRWTRDIISSKFFFTQRRYRNGANKRSIPA